MTIQHKELAAGRWAKMTLAEQMANIGSEVQRALNWRQKNNLEYSNRAFERALELLDLTLDSHRKLSNLKEIARVREVIVNFFTGSNDFLSTDTGLRRYFSCFNYSARK